MRKPVLLIFTNACILIAIFALLSQSLFVTQRVALASAVRGKVTVQRGGTGSPEPLSEGMAVKATDILRSQANSSAEIAWSDGTRWKLFGNSEASIGQGSHRAAGQSVVSQVQLNQGGLLVRLPGPLSSQSSFEVETPSALLVSHGQVFRVAINSGYTAVDVFKGSVTVNPGQDTPEMVAEPSKRLIESGKGWISEPVKSTNLFWNEPDFIKPRLAATAHAVDNDHVLINGETEAGSKVVIDGKDFGATGNGIFLRRLKVEPGIKSWKVQSIDPYGQGNEVATSLSSCSH